MLIVNRIFHIADRNSLIPACIYPLRKCYFNVGLDNQAVSRQDFMNQHPQYSILQRNRYGYMLLCLLLLLQGTSDLRAQSPDTIPKAGVHENDIHTHIAADTAGIEQLIAGAGAVSARMPDTAIVMLRTAVTRSREINYRRGITKGLTELGTIYLNTGSYDQAIAVYLLSLSLQTNERGKAHMYNNLGAAYSASGNYRQAISCFMQALRILEGMHDLQDMLGSTYNNFASIFFDMGLYDKGILYLEKGEAIHRQTKNNKSLAMVLNNKGVMFSQNNRPDEGIRSLQEALVLSRTSGDKETEILVLNNLGDAYMKKNEPDKALRNLREAIADMQETTNPYTKAPILISLAQAYFRQQHYKQAEDFLNKALRLNIPKYTLEAHRQLSALYGKTGDYRQAWLHESFYSRLHDSLMDAEKTKGINQLETRYRTAQKDKEITAKQLLIAQQQIYLGRKNTWIWITSLSILLLGITIILLYRNNRHKQYLQEEKIRVLMQEQEIKLLKAMMTGEEKERTRLGRELHDGVGGLLSAIKINISTMRIHNKMLAETEHFRNVLELVDEATGELRKTAHNLMPEVLLKGGITEAVNNFCRHIPTEQIPEVQVQTYGRIPRMDASFELAIYRIIQELVHNIVKHAHATQALVQLNWQEKLFSITIEDNGIGTTAEDIRKSNGIGLKNIQARVNALEGQMELESTGSGTTVYIEFDTGRIKNNIIV